MQGKDFIIGTRKSSGCLKTKSEEILLTKIPTQAAQSPESAILKVAMEDVGKMSILRGKLSDKEECPDIGHPPQILIITAYKSYSV